jgi:DnaJ-class molecular chaperone
MTVTSKPPKPKKNIWKEASSYGTYEGKQGSKEEWRQAFEEAWTYDKARKVTEEESPWGILNISADSSVEIIKSAFRKLMLIHHPDKGGNPEIARKIMAAYYLLIEGKQ